MAAIDAALASGEPEYRRWAVNTILAYAWGRPAPIKPDGETEAGERATAPGDTIELAKRVVWLLTSASTKLGGNV